MIEITKKKQRECNKHGLSARDMALADLVLAGWGKWDAYIAMGLYMPALSDLQNDTMFRKVTENPNFIAYINKVTLDREKQKEKEKKERKAAAKARKAEADNAEMPTEEEMTFLTKEEVSTRMIRAMNRLAEENPKEYVASLERYSKFMSMQKEEVKTEDTTVHYYLPLTCSKCSAYLAMKRAKKNE